MKKYQNSGIVFIASVILSIAVLGTGCVSGPASVRQKTGMEEGAAKKTNEKTVLTFWSWAYDTDTIKSVYETAIKNFNARNKYNVEIKSSYTTGEQYNTKLQTEMAANNAPDIFNMWAAGRMLPFVAANRLFPIGDEIMKDAEWRSRYIDGVFELTTFNNRIYGVPQFRVACMVFYNKDMFNNFGINVPGTWTDLVNVITTLKKNNKEAFALDAKDTWIAAMYAEYIADRIDPDAYKNAVKNKNWLVPAYIETGKKMRGLVEAGAFPQNATDLDYTSARNLFDQEKAGMYVMGNWDVGYLSNDSPIRDKIGVFKFPAIEGGKGAVDDWLAGIEAVISVSTRCKEPRAAAAFLKYLTEPEIAQDLIAEKGGYIPTVKISPDNARLSRLYIEADALLRDEKARFVFYDVFLGFKTGSEFNSAIQSIINGETPEEVFKRVDEVAKEVG